MPIVFQLENDQNRSLHDDAISILSEQFGAKLPNQYTNFAREFYVKRLPWKVGDSCCNFLIERPMELILQSWNCVKTRGLEVLHAEVQWYVTYCTGSMR